MQRFTPRPMEQGRHLAYKQAMEGEYVFGVDRGNNPPLETYNQATAELQGIIRTCVQEGKSLRAHGSLWSLSAVAVTAGKLIDNTALRLSFEVPADLTDQSMQEKRPNYVSSNVAIRLPP